MDNIRRPTRDNERETMMMEKSCGGRDKGSSMMRSSDGALLMNR